MKKVDREEFTVTDRGIEVDVVANRYEHGKGARDELSITLQSDAVDPAQRRYDFVIADADDRVAAFKRSWVDGEGEPSRAALLALGKYGWECRNFDVEWAERPTGKEIHHALSFTDDLLDGVLRTEDSPLSESPLLLDIIEVAQTATALVNEVVRADSVDEDFDLAGGADFREDILDPDGEHHDLSVAWVAVEANRDPYCELFLPELFELHTGKRVPGEEIDRPTGRVASILEAMLKSMGRYDRRYGKDRRPPGFDGITWGEFAEKRRASRLDD